MRVKDSNSNLRDIGAMCVKHQGMLRAVDCVVVKSNGMLRIVWMRATEQTGWVFTQGHPISVSGRMIRLNGQK